MIEFTTQRSTGANNQDSNENKQINVKGKTKATKKVDTILSEFRKIFQRQLEHNFEVKTSSLKKALANKCSDEYTEDVFHHDVAKRIDLLLSSAHFQEAILAKGLNPFNAASHFVLLGWQKLEDCILRGGYNDIQNYEEWAQPMFNRDRMELYTPHIKDMLKRQPTLALMSKTEVTPTAVKTSETAAA